MSAQIDSLEGALTHIQGILDSSQERFLLGIVGKPGSGKSTFTKSLVNGLKSPEVALINMDGYHMSNEILLMLDRRERKGAPDTFDVGDFAQLLKTVRSAKADVFFPLFDRSIEASIPDGASIPAHARLIIVEGNYLLHDEGGWEEIAPLLDQSWFLDIDEWMRQSRLISRHIHYGKSPEAAREWALGSDENNAQLIEGGRTRADYIVKA
jgi:pantothenate kinase